MKFAYSAMAVMLLLSVASAVTFIGTLDDGSSVVEEEAYVALIKASKNQMRVNNMFGMQMFPTAIVGGAAVPMNVPIVPVLQDGQVVSNYQITYPENFANQVYVSAAIALEPEYIQHTITLENTDENEEKLVDLEILLSGTGSTYIYAPYKRNPGAKYLLLSPPYNMEKAEALIVAFDNLMPSFEQPLEINVKPSLSKTLSWNIKLAAKSTQTISLKYSTGYVTDETLLQQSGFNPSISKQYLINTGTDGIFNILNRESVSEFDIAATDGMTATDLLTAISDALDSLPDTVSKEEALPRAIDITDVNSRQGTGITSLEKAVVFRELARENGLPAELHIGLKDGEYYAWTEAFIGSSKFTYDPRKDKGEYTEVYAEPSLTNCKGDDMQACPWSGGIRTDLLCIGDFCVSGFILIALAALVFIALFAIFQYKTELIYPLLGSHKSAGGMMKRSLAGTYNVIETKYVPKNPLENAVFGELKRRSGVFNEVDYARTTGFSEPLVQSALEYFLDIGIIKKRY